MKSDTATAFRKWAQNINKSQEFELKTTLSLKVKERKTEEERGRTELKKQEEEKGRLTNELHDQTQQRDQAKQNFEQAFDTHVDRVQNNVYIEKRRNVLNTWRDYVRKERNAVNVIGAIARRTLRIEVFQRIRMTARENYLDKDAMRRCLNFWTMFKHSNLKKAFSRWRQNSYKCCVLAK
jgi:hypothetical protein